MKPFTRFARDEAGLETVEYAIMAGLIVATSVALIVALGAWVKSTYTNMQKELK